MKKNRISVIWLPSASSSSYLFFVPRLLICLLLGTLLVSWVMLGIGGYLGIRLHRDYLRLKEENIRLTQKKIELGSVRLSLDSIREYEDLIRNVLDLEREREEEVGTGQGGMPTDRTFYNVPEGNPASSTMALITSADSSAILEQAESLQESLHELVAIVRERRHFMETAPSIVPVKTNDYWISSGFGWRRSPFAGQKEFHDGLDISGRRGTPIIAPGSGRVIKKGNHRYRGKYLQISHGWGRITTYAHLSKFNVTQGQEIKRGQVIAFMGSSGRSTGPHLHYEIEIDGKVVNPMHYVLDSKTVESNWRPLNPIGGGQ